MRLILGRCPETWERRIPRLIRIDPRVLLDAHPAAEEFHAAMSVLHVGGAIKITSSDRHGAADELNRRGAQRFELVAQTEHPAEIAALVAAVEGSGRPDGLVPRAPACARGTATRRGTVRLPGPPRSRTSPSRR